MILECTEAENRGRLFRHPAQNIVDRHDFACCEKVYLGDDKSLCSTEGAWALCFSNLNKNAGTNLALVFATDQVSYVLHF